MAKLWVVIKREYFERVRTKWFIIVTVFGPLFFGAIMVLPGYLSFKGMTSARVTNIHILDASSSGLGERIAERVRTAPRQSIDSTQLSDAEKLALQIAAANQANVVVSEVSAADMESIEDSLLKAVQAKELTGYLVIDSATVANGTARYAGRNAGSIGETSALESRIRSALLGLRIENAGLDAVTAASLTRLNVRLQSERVTDSGREGSGLANTIFGFAVAFLLYMSIILYGQNILRGVLEEKTTRVAEVVVSSVSTDTLLAGKVIGVGAVGLTQMLIWAGSGFFFWTQRGRALQMMGVGEMPSIPMPSIAPGTLIALLLFFILGYTFYAALFAAIGAMVGSQEEAQQASQPVIMLLVMSIIFVQPIMTNPTGPLAEVMSLLPFSAPIIMPLRMTATEVSGLELTMALGGLLLACIVAIWVSARIYRIGLLMYGKRPSLRELGRWIRQA